MFHVKHSTFVFNKIQDNVSRETKKSRYCNLSRETFLKILK